MNLLTVCVLFSSLSFFAYAYSYFKAPKMKEEFKRFGLEKLGFTVIVLEILGATGLLVGLKFNLILLISSLGLSLLMLAGVLVRIKIKDTIWISLPAFFYMVLNGFVFCKAMNLF